ncbi:hypothetical protein ALC62_04225 [Cyphomyrmex costatus]|uniref:Uncharacterized protein n=1 Tax=Cyphomyrmex costatus TaxID=456900 RepID=A0A195CVY6_9HYME|nr:hypothetical protein ALC62_04225 [Cyphomyrmex costatus]
MKNSRWQIVCLNDKTRREARESVRRKNFYRTLEYNKTGCTEILLPYLIPLSLMRDVKTSQQIQK